MSIIVYYSPYFPACRMPRHGAPAGLIWCDVAQHLEQAAALGVTLPPAIVVDSKLRWQGSEALRRQRTGTLS